MTTLHCRMPKPSQLWAPSHISPHLEHITFVNNYVHIETKSLPTVNVDLSYLARLVGWVWLNFGLCYKG
jgi:hypothetical protein